MLRIRAILILAAMLCGAAAAFATPQRELLLAVRQFYLSWFGAGGRTHSLLVSFLANGPGSPPCLAPMQRVFSALGHARFVVVRDPATLLLAVP